MLRLPRLALALALLAAPAAAQQIQFPPGQSYVGSEFTFHITWEGRPALLLVGQGAQSFIRYELQYPPSAIPTPVFRLAAAHFMDARPCARGSQVHLNFADYQHFRHFGNMDAAGMLTWMPGFGLGQRIAFDRSRHLSGRSYEVTYCMAMGGCYDDCSMSKAPQIQALVLVYESYEW